VKGALRPSQATRLYMDEKSTGTGELINRRIGKQRKEKRNRSCAATLSDLYPSTCLAWEALPGVYINSSQHSYPGHWGTQSSPTTTTKR